MMKIMGEAIDRNGMLRNCKGMLVEKTLRFSYHL